MFYWTIQAVCFRSRSYGVLEMMVLFISADSAVKKCICFHSWQLSAMHHSSCIRRHIYCFVTGRAWTVLSSVTGYTQIFQTEIEEQSAQVHDNPFKQHLIVKVHFFTSQRACREYKKKIWYECMYNLQVVEYVICKSVLLKATPPSCWWTYNTECCCFLVCFQICTPHWGPWHPRAMTPVRVSQRSRDWVKWRGMLSKASEFICFILCPTLVSASDQHDYGWLEEGRESENGCEKSRASAYCFKLG